MLSVSSISYTCTPSVDVNAAAAVVCVQLMIGG